MTIVSPWFCHEELAEDYFAAVSPELQEDDELLIVDNGSEPPLDFAGIRLERNLGFVGGSNLGLEHATRDAVLFLNNDIALGRAGWLAEIREALEPGLLVGPLRFYGHAAVDGAAFPYIDGWCLAGMRDELLELGGFDGSLVEPAYYSDNLLCLAAREAGMTLRDVRVGLRHKESVTSEPHRNPQAQYAARVNRARYLARARTLLVHNTP